MNYKKAQITIFFIIGIILIASMFFVFYLNNQIHGNEIVKTKKQIEDENRIRSVVYDDIQSCFNQACLKGLEELGNNGGYLLHWTDENPYQTKYKCNNSECEITKFKDFSIGDDNFIRFKVNGNLKSNYHLYYSPENQRTYRVIYSPSVRGNNIDKKNYRLEDSRIWVSDLNDPSLKDITFSNKNELYIDVSGHVKINKLPSQCKNYHKEIDNLTKINSCYNSVESRLEDFIKHHFFACMEPLREEWSGYTIKPNKFEDLNLDSIFSKKNIEFFITSDIIMNSTTSDSVIKFPKLNSNSYNFGLDSFYSSCFNNFLDEEATNVLNNIVGLRTKMLSNIGCNDEFVDYNVGLSGCTKLMREEGLFYLCNWTLYGGANKIKNYESGLEGRPFSYKFMIKNRAPVMESINSDCDNSCDIKYTSDKMIIKVRMNDPDVFFDNLNKVYSYYFKYDENTELNNCASLNPILLKDSSYNLEIPLNTVMNGDKLKILVCDGPLNYHCKPKVNGTLCDDEIVVVKLPPKN